MLKNLFLRLDEKGWPQDLVAWALRRRARSRLNQLLFPRTTATTAISLFVASPTVAMQDLVEAVVPSVRGGWRDYVVRARQSTRNTAVVILVDPREDTEFTLSFPVHQGFSRLHFRGVQVIRLTRETERSAVVSVREPSGGLLACGTLELIPRACYSRKVP